MVDLLKLASEDHDERYYSYYRTSLWLYPETLSVNICMLGEGTTEEHVLQWFDKMGIERPQPEKTRRWYKFKDDSLWKLLDRLAVV